MMVPCMTLSSLKRIILPPAMLPASGYYYMKITEKENVTYNTVCNKKLRITVLPGPVNLIYICVCVFI